MGYDVVHHTQVVASMLDSKTDFAVVTLVSIRGSAPQVLGAKAVVSQAGIVAGTIGGGKIEAAAIQYAQDLLAKDGKSCEMVKWNLQTDIGMTCGGEVQLLFEVHRQDHWPIAVFGAGHVSQALVPLLTQLDCQVTCVDSRSEWLDKLEDHAKLTKRCLERPEEIVEELPDTTFFVLMSKGHATDLPVLKKVLCTRTPRYIGVIGSAQKAKVLKRDLDAAGVSRELQESFWCPMGLPLGNNTPAEIAISIVGQLLQVRDEGPIVEGQAKS